VICSEGTLVEEPAIAPFAELGWQAVLAAELGWQTVLAMDEVLEPRSTLGCKTPGEAVPKPLDP
jgi:hypothetical protein